MVSRISLTACLGRRWSADLFYKILSNIMVNNVGELLYVYRGSICFAI